ncbi:MAG: hypothetical protein C4563_06430 [Desulfobulbus sp.]|jgi:hypothetical protein|nr:MAG: hypothetical protein C4563_06430 [Desulfobulbus sp.]
MIGNTGSINIAIEVNDKGSGKLRSLGNISEEAARKGETGFAGMRKSLNDLDQSSHVTLGTLTMLGAAAAALAVAAAGGMMKTVKAASDLAETTSKFNVVFAGQVEQAEAWAQELVSGYAMSTREARQYLSSVQDLLVPMGMQADAAGEMSNQVVRLAADLGSFNNLPTAQVMDDIQSALVGNYETMKKYGVVLNESTVQEKALAMGLAKTKDELTAGIKAQAAYALMVNGSQAAIGDMTRTADGYANQLKKFHANIEDLTAGFGQRLLPIATDAISRINVALGGSAGGVDALAQAMSVRLLQAIRFVVQGVQFLHNGFNGLVLVGQTIINAYAMVFDYLAKGLRAVATPLDLIFQGLVKLGMIDANPFDALASAATMFREVAGEVLDEHIAKIGATNAAYDATIATLDGYIAKAGESSAATSTGTATVGTHTGALAADSEALGMNTGALTVNATARQTAKQAADALTTAIQNSAVLLGAEAMAYELSTDGMYGYQTAMQLAYEETNLMLDVVNELTGGEDALAASTSALAGSYDQLAGAAAQAAAAVNSVNTAAPQGSPGPGSSGDSEYGAPADYQPGVGLVISPAMLASHAQPQTTNNSTVINVQQQVSRNDILALLQEKKRREARS